LIKVVEIKAVIMGEENLTKHVPVLLKEVIASFDFPGEFLDVTLGGGGHTEAILKTHKGNTVVALDRDVRAVERTGQKLLQKYKQRLFVNHAQFSNIKELCGERLFDGVLADLGMSTDQLREGRGFSFADSSALDMRMDETAFLSAAHVVNDYSESQLAQVFYNGGVGSASKSLARSIIDSRPVESTSALVKVVQRVIRKQKESGSHPATVVFQALRMEVNQEFQELRSLLRILPNLVRSGGRVSIISFHSLEDKEVTQVLRSWANGSTVPARVRNAMHVKPIGKLITKKAIQPDSAEIEANPASRSARMRVFEFH
jgi:16S rRNA (cytosine1402-N4)-methyltransferase